MFRLQQNVPDVYPQESRDFQIFCRAYDGVFNGVKYGVNSLTHTSNTLECNNSLLSLLANKLGLFTNLNLPDTELRYILSAFPYIIRYKGARISIDYTLRVFQRIARMGDLEYTVSIDNETRQISIVFNREIINDQLLYELLSYIIPTGYTCIYVVYKKGENITRVVIPQTVDITVLNPIDLSKVYYSKDDTSGVASVVGGTIVTSGNTPTEVRDESE